MTRAAGRAALTADRFLAASPTPSSSLYLLHGPDDYLLEQVLQRLRREVLSNDFAEFNHLTLRCTPTTRPAQLVGALVELPMLADRRLLEIHDLQHLPAETLRAILPALGEAARSGTTVTALGWRPGGRGGRTHALDELEGLGLRIECSLPPAERPAWVRAGLRERKLKADPEAIEEILHRTGSDLRHLATQLDKLALYAGTSRQVGLLEVREVVGRSREVRTWAMTSAISERDLASALSVLSCLLDEGEAPIALISYLNTYLKGLVQVLSVSRQVGRSPAAVAARIKGRTEFQVRKTLRELDTWSEGELRLALDMLCRADLRLKSGSDPRLILELLMFQLCQRRGRSRS